MSKTKQNKTNKFFKIIRQITSTPIGTKTFSRLAHTLDIPLLRMSKGRFSISRLLTGMRVILVTTTGAKSGLERRVPLLPIMIEKKIILIGSNWGQAHHPAWVYNMRANSHVTVITDGSIGKYTAYESEGDVRQRYWEKAIELFPGYAQYEKRANNRQISVFVLNPMG